MGIETILYAYIHQQRTAEEIAQIYLQITLEQIYATILYYWHYKQWRAADVLETLINALHQQVREQLKKPKMIGCLRC